MVYDPEQGPECVEQPLELELVEVVPDDAPDRLVVLRELVLGRLGPGDIDRLVDKNAQYN